MQDNLSSNEIGYLAGVIDGEGSIHILRRILRKGTLHGYSYEIRLSVANTNIDLINWLIEKCGGCCYDVTPINREKHKRQYRWQLSRAQTDTVLSTIYPYLVVKKRQCELALKYLEMGRKSDPVVRSEYYSQMRI